MKWYMGFMILCCVGQISTAARVSAGNELTVAFIKPTIKAVKGGDAQQKSVERKRVSEEGRKLREKVRAFERFYDRRYYKEIGVNFVILDQAHTDYEGTVPAIAFYKHGVYLPEYTIEITEDADVESVLHKNLTADSAIGDVIKRLDRMYQELQRDLEVARQKAAYSILYPGPGTWYNYYYNPYYNNFYGGMGIYWGGGRCYR